MDMSASDELRIIDYADGHKGAVERLFAVHFGPFVAANFSARWDWQYRRTEALFGRRSIIRLLSVGDEIVGHVSAFPLPLRIEGRVAPVLAASGLAVDPRFRLAALRLLREILVDPPLLGTAMSEPVVRMMQRAGATIIPESTTRHVFRLSRAGELRCRLQSRMPPGWAGRLPEAPFRLAASIEGSLRVVRTLRQLPAGGQSFEIRQLEGFDEQAGTLWNSVAPNYQWSIDRSQRYLNWRYVECPGLSATRLGAFDGSGQLAGILVALTCVQLNRHRVPGAANMEITELICRPDAKDCARAMVRCVLELACKQGLGSVAATGVPAEAGAALCDNGFRMEPGNRYIACLFQQPPSGLEVFPETSWRYSAGDGDSLYLNAV